jgi:NAD(P)-dependent dehydrogenase (short-subunit alcohol dehydrogenase family)
LQENGTEAIALPTDLRDPEQTKHAIAETKRHFGRIDILINNAGRAAAGTIAEVSPDDFQQIIDVNIFGPLVAIQEVVPIMRKQGGGMIVNVSSMVSKMHIPGLSAYAATKSALNMLSDTARVELASYNIRVISIFPRMTATDFGIHSLGSQNLRGQQRSNPSVPVDSADYVAERILSAAINEPEEQYMDH